MVCIVENFNPSTHDIKGIEAITAYSGDVVNGGIFVAIDGLKTRGALFVADAIVNGAKVVVAHHNALEEIRRLGLEQIWLHTNTRLAYAQLAARIYQPQPSRICAVTGTNGKSSIVEFARQIARQLGIDAASMGTLGVVSDAVSRSVGLTTPDTARIHQDLRAMASADIGFVAMEASSHGLSMHRLDGVKLCAAAFSNFTQDHLDYHIDMAQYFVAKSRVFSEILPSGATAILPLDDACYAKLHEICAARDLQVWGFGKAQNASFGVRDWQPQGDGATVIFAINATIAGAVVKQDIACHISLLGEFQAQNIACALALVAASYPDEFCQQLDRLPAIIGNIQAPKGRAEIVAKSRNKCQVIVDFAHTPDALETLFRAVKHHCQHGRLLCVLGAGGDRDQGKRPLFGTIASRYCQKIFVTDDNPRTEDPAKIRGAIMNSATNAVEIADRREAILCAMQAMQTGDILLVLGKGHEQGQDYGNHIVPFDDTTIVRRIADDIWGGA